MAWRALLASSARVADTAVPVFEQYVRAAATGTEEYNTDAVLALVKLYQFYPQRLNRPALATALALALSRMPDDDYLSAVLMTPERINQQGEFLSLARMSHYLESGLFQEFWAESTHVASITDSIKGFRSAIQRYMASIISATYASIDAARVNALLQVDAAGLDALAKANGWTLRDGSVHFPRAAASAASAAASSGILSEEQLVQLLEQSQA